MYDNVMTLLYYTISTLYYDIYTIYMIDTTILYYTTIYRGMYVMHVWDVWVSGMYGRMIT